MIGALVRQLGLAVALALLIVAACDRFDAPRPPVLIGGAGVSRASAGDDTDEDAPLCVAPPGTRIVVLPAPGDDVEPEDDPSPASDLV